MVVWGIVGRDECVVIIETKDVPWRRDDGDGLVPELEGWVRQKWDALLVSPYAVPP
jgi:hypothetical protein